MPGSIPGSGTPKLGRGFYFIIAVLHMPLKSAREMESTKVLHSHNPSFVSGQPNSNVPSGRLVRKLKCLRYEYL